MYRIGKTFKFDAAHSLKGLPEGHKCSRLHGHTYTVIFTVESSQLTEEGWVIDFGDFNVLKEWIDNRLDHRDLNEVLYPIQTTAENLAGYLYDVAQSLGIPVSNVVVKETENTFAEYRP